MKLSILFYQDDVKFSNTFEVDKKETDQKLIVGTVLNELFTVESNYRNANMRLFKTSKPILFKVTNGKNEILNLGKSSKFIQDKLKFNKTAKSKRTFAKRVNLAITEMSRNVEVINQDDIFARLEEQIKLEEQSK